MLSVVAALLLLAVYGASGHSYHLGDCPQVEPMKNFDIDKFLGKWFVMQKTNTGSSCLINFYTRDPEGHSGKFKIEQISDHFLMKLSRGDKYHYVGDLSIPDDKAPAAMRVKFPLNIAGGASYTVFDTDYNTYAGIFTCQQLTFAHRRSVSILSREKTLDPKYASEIRKKLSDFGIDPYNLSIIKQENCTDPVKTESSEETFSADKVAEVFRQAGEKIGDGFETVAESAKKFYNNVRGDHETSNEEVIENANAKDDVEWLP